MANELRQLTVEAVEAAILDALVAAEAEGKSKTSPTAVCELLADRGYRTMRGGWACQKPDRAAFDFVCDVARESFTYRIHGNFRSIAL